MHRTQPPAGAWNASTLQVFERIGSQVEAKDGKHQIGPLRIHQALESLVEMSVAFVATEPVDGLVQPVRGKVEIDHLMAEIPQRIP